jgi:hypothetical protein
MRRTANYSSRGAEIDFPSIETYLGSALRPIQPREIFVTGLKSKLKTEALTRRPGLSLSQFVLVAVIGISSSILLVFTGVRALVAILGALSLLRLVATPAHKKEGSVTIVPAR